MIDITILREQSEQLKKNLQARNMDPKRVDVALMLDEKWRKAVGELDQLRGALKKASDARDIETAKATKAKIKEAEVLFQTLEEERMESLYALPNLLDSDVPTGKDETENKVLRTWGTPTKFDFTPKDHIAIGAELGLINTERAAEVSGARFAYLLRGAALLEFALIQHAFTVLTSPAIMKKIAKKVSKNLNPKPFVPVVPPVMIRPDVFRKMGRLTKEDADERYHLPKDDLYLVGSAEHTLGPLHMGETLKEGDAPLRYVGFSTAFRREAGSYGKDVKGILRVHQFDKVELESFTLPEHSKLEQDFFVAIQEYLMQSLKLPYRVMLLCSGDMGKPDARQIDIETWLPGQNKYRETHSSDYMTDFQSRRLGIKVKRADGKNEFMHTNDATVFAIGRMIIAILENYQTKKGTVKVPNVLQKYIGMKEIKGV